MTNNDKLLEMLMRHEGFRSKLYHCTAGKLTIGYGHNIEDRGISKPIARLILMEDINIAMHDLYGVFPDFWKYTENRRMALIDTMFAMGLPTFKQFKKMIATILEGDWGRAADELKNSEWYNQVGVRGPEIEQMIRQG